MIIRRPLLNGEDGGVSFKWLIYKKNGIVQTSFLNLSQLGLTFSILAFVHNQLVYTLNHSTSAAVNGRVSKSVKALY